MELGFSQFLNCTLSDSVLFKFWSVVERNKLKGFPFNLLRAATDQNYDELNENTNFRLIHQYES